VDRFKKKMDVRGGENEPVYTKDLSAKAPESTSVDWGREENQQRREEGEKGGKGIVSFSRCGG